MGGPHHQQHTAATLHPKSLVCFKLALRHAHRVTVTWRLLRHHNTRGFRGTYHLPHQLPPTTTYHHLPPHRGHTRPPSPPPLALHCTATVLQAGHAGM
jgi:hypothetical protein